MFAKRVSKDGGPGAPNVQRKREALGSFSRVGSNQAKITKRSRLEKATEEEPGGRFLGNLI